LSIKKAVLKSFDSVLYTATICISGSSKSYLEGIAVARNLLAVEMGPERKLAAAYEKRETKGISHSSY